MKEIMRIEIPNYMTHVKLCDSREKKFYTPHTRVPARYLNDNYSFDSYGILVKNETGEKVLANPKTADTPKLKKINGHEIYHGKLSPLVRARMIKEMTSFYRSHLPKIKRINQLCKLKLEIHNTLTAGNQDINNLSWVIVKVIKDALVSTRILPENTDQVLKGYEVELLPISIPSEQKIVISILPISEKDIKPVYHELL